MKLIYFYDALCGWCYGFSPTIQKFASVHQDEFTVEVKSGGMILGDRVGPIGEIAPYIKSAYKTVEEKTGVTFGEKFINDVLHEGSAILSSEPPAVALAAFKVLLPNKQLAYATGLQRLIYYDGVTTDNRDEFIRLAVQLGAQRDEMKAQLDDPKTQERAEQEFAYAQQLGVTGYPMTVLEKEDKLYALAQGAVDFATLEANLNSVIKSNQ